MLQSVTARQHDAHYTAGTWQDVLKLSNLHQHQTAIKHSLAVSLPMQHIQLSTTMTTIFFITMFTMGCRHCHGSGPRSRTCQCCPLPAILVKGPLSHRTKADTADQNKSLAPVLDDDCRADSQVWCVRGMSPSSYHTSHNHHPIPAAALACVAGWPSHQD